MDRVTLIPRLRFRYEPRPAADWQRRADQTEELVPMGRILTQNELAAEWGVTLMTLYNRRHWDEDPLPHHELPIGPERSHVYYYQIEVEQWLGRNRHRTVKRSKRTWR